MAILHHPTKENLNGIRSLLERLAARYLYLEKKRKKAFDPVANFHIRNGAEIFRINWEADTSARRIKESFGMMVNYRYVMENIERNNRKYVLDDHIEANENVLNLLK